jgi:nucleotide-binding universal stress UspA family protein
MRHCEQSNEGGAVRGTIVCGVTDRDDEGHAALELGAELSRRLGLRLVLAHVTEDLAPSDGNAFLARLAREHGVGDTAECRVSVGEPALRVRRIAAEEAAVAIVVGSQARRWPGRGFESRLAEKLKGETPVPILIAPPANGRRRKAAVANAAR